MAVSGINSYRDTMYQWQAQQLKSTGSGSSSSSTALNTLFGGSASMTSQISSMVELTKYAMDAMGVSSDSRVTFSQITRYREQLQSEFNTAVKNGLEQSGISDLNALGFELGKDGKIAVTGANAADRKAAQAWLDANPKYGQTLLAAMPVDAFENGGAITFTISSTGQITASNRAEQELQDIFAGKTTLAESIRNGIKTAGITISYPLDLKFDPSGNLEIKGDSEDAEAINQWFKENPELADTVKKEIAKYNIDPSATTLALNQEGAIRINISNIRIRDIQAAFDKNRETGASIRNGLSSLGIDPNISFAVQVNADGTVTIVSDHPDVAKVQRFFDENPELVKKYRQIETLAGIDDARKAMQISPSAMRKRFQIESLASWWADSGNSNSYFGQYSNNSLSLMAGLNLNI